MWLTRQVVSDLVEAARGSRPEECCGIILAGPGDSGLGVRLLPTDNLAGGDRARSYRLSHRVHLRAVAEEARSAAVILAYYHSHPAGPAKPSRADAELACPGAAYLIVGMAPRLELRAWRWTGERFEEEIIQTPSEVGP